MRAALLTLVIKDLHCEFCEIIAGENIDRSTGNHLPCSVQTITVITATVCYSNRISHSYPLVLCLSVDALNEYRWCTALLVG